MKQCSLCRRALPLDAFYHDRASRDGHKSRCKQCMTKRRRVYRATHLEAIRKKQQERLLRIRDVGIMVYGEKCVCCGEAHPAALTIDHIHGRQGHEKKALKEWERLAALGFPRGEVQLLCWTCNAVKGIYGRCIVHNA